MKIDMLIETGNKIDWNILLEIIKKDVENGLAVFIGNKKQEEEMNEMINQYSPLEANE